nr:hypothetical protein CFP56_24466 [Quercus suber]
MCTTCPPWLLLLRGRRACLGRGVAVGRDGRVQAGPHRVGRGPLDRPGRGGRVHAHGRLAVGRQQSGPRAAGPRGVEVAASGRRPAGGDRGDGRGGGEEPGGGPWSRPSRCRGRMSIGGPALGRWFTQSVVDADHTARSEEMCYRCLARDMILHYSRPKLRVKISIMRH